MKVMLETCCRLLLSKLLMGKIKFHGSSKAFLNWNRTTGTDTRYILIQ